MDIPSVKRQVAKARADGIAVRGLVFINPGKHAAPCRTQLAEQCIRAWG